ncbi:BMC_2a_G0000010.mRNA.1.CDS.1 [Saccharomyces cerevisiae]|nr:BMC_2a_G0000010.mRNA.1.CDS.1 [Saccharomyces cerevisiae]CAI7032600.1 BMC_2a_G0000010.mRNA.1.CDS.1 [Saccharomyces cerevisiae]
MPYAHGCYSIYSSQTYPTFTFHSTPISHFISTKRTHIIMHGTCLSGLYPVPFTHKSTIIHTLISISHLAVPNIV